MTMAEELRATWGRMKTEVDLVEAQSDDDEATEEPQKTEAAQEAEKDAWTQFFELADTVAKKMNTVAHERWHSTEASTSGELIGALIA